MASGSTYAYPTPGALAVPPPNPPAPKHAASSIPGIAGANGALGTAFTYDANGNFTAGAGLTATWTSFDMPLQIARGTITGTFGYGPEHQRIRQTRSDSTTIIYAGAQEVETKTGVGTTVKTYWPYGVGVEIDRPATGNELNWVHVDRLGSPVAISDSSGNLKEKLAYDAWGKRRTISGAPVNGTATPNTIDGVVDNRGFTGHEMLDQLDLVHMNGRVYEPFLGRFLSADPLVQDPLNGQSYNRYSYVLNNPTNLTDPTGFASMCEGHTSLCGFTSIWSSVQQVAVDAYERLSPTSQANVRDLLEQKNAKNDAPAGGGAEKGKSDKTGGDSPSSKSFRHDVYRGAWNGAIGLIEYIPNIGTLPGAVDYLPFLADFRQPYENENFGTVAEIVLTVGGLRVAGEIGAASRGTKIPATEALAAKSGGALGNDLLAAANKPFNDSGISQAARAWDKHSFRSGGTFEPLSGTTAEKNAAAAAWVRSTIENPSATRTLLPRGGIEYRIPNGQGFIVEANGNFNLLDPRR